MRNNLPSKSLLALLSLALIFTGSAAASAANHTAEYPPVPGQIEPPEPGEKAEIIKEKPPLDPDNEVKIPKAPESDEVLVIRLLPPTASTIATLNDKNPPAVQVRSGLVLGGVDRGNSDVAKVTVDSNSNTKSEIQAPKGTPIAITLGGYSAGEKVVVIVSQGGKSVNLGTFTASGTGRLVLPAATLTGNSNQEFSFKSGGETVKVVLRPTAPAAGFSTLKAKFKKSR